MLSLPFPPRKAHLRSFWLVISFAAVLVTGAGAAFVAGWFWGLLVAALVCIVSLAVLRRPSVQLKSYRLWNKGATLLGKAGYRWTLYLTHRLLIRAIGPSGSRFNPFAGEATSTTWSLFPDAVNAPPVDQIEWRNWSREYGRWARQSGNRWGLLVWPFLSMMSLFRDEHASTAAPSNIYTLF